MSISLVQAVLAPLFAFASDAFQARKPILIFSCTIAFVSACIAPGSHDINRLIVAQCLIGCGISSVPLTYAIPSEVMPRSWRPMVQAGMNCASSLGVIFSTLVIGGMTKANAEHGWRNFLVTSRHVGVCRCWYIIWLSTTKKADSHGRSQMVGKLRCLDLPGFGLLTSGLCMFLTWMNLGGGIYPWRSAHVIVVLVLGLMFLIAFGLWEWKGTKIGILHHDLFTSPQSSVFVLCTLLILLEGAMLFSIVIFHPSM